jgi:hypothetical protein
MSAYLDRWTGLDGKAETIMTTAMKACKDGPRKEQKDLKGEIKDAGIRWKVFQALLKVRNKTDEIEEAGKDLEDDDLDQFREIAANFKEQDSDDLFAQCRRAGSRARVASHRVSVC